MEKVYDAVINILDQMCAVNGRDTEKTLFGSCKGRICVLILWCGIRVLKKLTKGESYEVLTSKEWGILFVDFVVYCMANENMEREVRRREDEAFREKVKSEMAMYRSMYDNLDRQRKRTHEYKNQIAAIGALAAADIWLLS